MNIKYYLRKIKTVNNLARYVATIVSNGTLDHNDLIEHMKRKGSTVSPSDMLAVLYDLEEICESELLKGYRIKIGKLCILSLSVSGIFEDLMDTFDKSRHKLMVNARICKSTAKIIQDRASLEKIEETESNPVINKYFDYESDSTDQIITPGSYGEISGFRLSMTPDNPDEHILLIDSDTGKRYPVVKYSRISPSKITFKIPPLPTEVTNIELMVVNRPFKYLKEVKTGIAFGKLKIQ